MRLESCAQPTLLLVELMSKILLTSSTLISQEHMMTTFIVLAEQVELVDLALPSPSLTK